MALQVSVTCSNHQKNDGGYGREKELWINTIDDQTAGRVKRALERDGWIVEFNGDNMDTYCSKKCAE